MLQEAAVAKLKWKQLIDFIYYHILQAVKMNLKMYPVDMVEYVAALKHLIKLFQKTTVNILLLKKWIAYIAILSSVW